LRGAFCKGNMATILIIEDEAHIARAVRDKLSHEGHLVDSVTSGPLALKFLEKSIPDLIILDVLMPDMDGFEVVERLKADSSTSSIPIMMLTVLSQDDKFQKLGVDAHLTKPYRGADLIRMVRDVLSRKSGGADGKQKDPSRG